MIRKMFSTVMGFAFVLTAIVGLSVSMVMAQEEKRQETASFKITEQSLEKLKSEGVPDDVLEKLQSLKNQEVIGEEKFLGILKETIGDEQTVRFKSLILKHAQKELEQNLEKTDIALQEVVITATRTKRKQIDVPAVTHIISDETLKETNTRILMEAVRTINGMDFSDRGGGMIGEIWVRGLGWNDTSGSNLLILVDGVPQLRLSDPQPGCIPVDNIERIEIVKNPGSALWGRGTMGGVMQIFTKRGAEKSGFNFSQTAGQNNYLKTDFGSLGPLGNIGFYNLTVSRESTDGWKEKNSDSQRDTLFSRFDFPLGQETSLQVNLSRFYADMHIQTPVLVNTNGDLLPGFSRGTNLVIPGSRYSKETNDVNTIFTHGINPDVTLTNLLTYSRENMSWDGGHFYDSGVPSSGTIIRRSPSIFTDETSRLYNDIKLEWKTKLGDIPNTLIGGVAVEYMDYDSFYQGISFTGTYQGVDYTNIGTPIDYLNPVEPSKSDYVYGAETRKHANQIVPGFYVQEEFEPVSWCILNGGLRYDQVTREQKDVGTGAESKVKPEHLTPNIGVTVRLFDILEWGSKSDALNLFGTYAQGFFPNFRGAGFEEIVVLKPEVSENKEVGLKGIFFGKSLQANLSYFQLSIKDKVVYTIDNQLENAGIYSSNGVELELRGRPFSDTDFEIYGGWTNLDTKWKYYMASGGVNLSGKYIQLVPKNMYLLGTNCSLGAFKIWIQGRYVGARYIDALNVNTDPAHFLGDIGIAYKYGKNLNISLNVLNFTDALYYGTTTFTKKNLAYVGNPREISLNMSLKF